MMHLVISIFPIRRAGLMDIRANNIASFEEFRGHSDIALPHLLMILDRYPARVEVKGSFTMFSASKDCFHISFSSGALVSGFR